MPLIITLGAAVRCVIKRLHGSQVRLHRPIESSPVEGDW